MGSEGWTSEVSGGRAEAGYDLLLRQLQSLWEPDLPLVANLANACALIKQSLLRTNWAGFYLWDPKGRQLVLGPFQGLPACTRIPWGQGVCGTAVRTRRILRVADVHQFPGHIACDSASASEIVLPLIRTLAPPASTSTASTPAARACAYPAAAHGAEDVLGVLDIDSPQPSRFDESDETGLSRVAALLVGLWPAGSPGERSQRLSSPGA
jgi:L-methionine (R)-S-oxide reductase